MRKGQTCFGTVMDEKGPCSSGKVWNKLQAVHSLHSLEKVGVVPGLGPHAEKGNFRLKYGRENYRHPTAVLLLYLAVGAL